MKHINELENSLTAQLGWHKSRVNCLSRMILALMAVRTVNLVDIACAFGGGNTKALSNYRRLQRFFSGYQVCYAQIACFVFGLFVGDKPVYLSLDRTNWQWGKRPINILVLALVHQGTAIPLYWRVLDRKGNSSTEQRQALVNRFIEQFGSACIAGLLCDREFFGTAWFEYLKKAHIPFYIRLRGDALATNRRGHPVNVWTLFMGLAYREHRILSGAREVYGVKVHLVGVRCDNGDQLIIASSQADADAIAVYRRRWEIETLFGCLKSRGFRFEETHMTHPERIEKLMAVLTIAFAWAHRVGEWRHEKQKPIKIKTHGRLAKSLFRYGLDFIREILFVGQFCMKQFRLCLRQLRTLNRLPKPAAVST